MFEEYMLSFLGLWVIIITVMIQQFVAIKAALKKGDFVPGQIAKGLDSESFVFRSNRTFMNSLENLVQFVIPVIIAMHLGIFNMTLAIIVWLFAIVRIGHMVAYYKNAAIKKYFFLLGFIFNVILMIMIAIQIFTL